MQTASIGKTFTAAGIMTLVADGKLRLDDSLATFFPGSPEWWKPITVRHLLAHTSGLPDWEGTADIDPKREYSEDDLIRLAQGLKPEFAPGERWSYSNTGYVVLGVLIHRLTGEFYGDYLDRRIWKPNGLPTMCVISDRDVIPRRAAGYDWSDPLAQPGPGIHEPERHRRRLPLRAPRRLSHLGPCSRRRNRAPASLQEAMWTSVRLNDGSRTRYGYGWEVDEDFGHRYGGHDGNWPGFTTAYLRYGLPLRATLASLLHHDLRLALPTPHVPPLGWAQYRRSRRRDRALSLGRVPPLR